MDIKNVDQHVDQIIDFYHVDPFDPNEVNDLCEKEDPKPYFWEADFKGRKVYLVGSLHILPAAYFDRIFGHFKKSLQGASALILEENASISPEVVERINQAFIKRFNCCLTENRLLQWAQQHKVKVLAAEDKRLHQLALKIISSLSTMTSPPNNLHNDLYTHCPMNSQEPVKRSLYTLYYKKHMNQLSSSSMIDFYKKLVKDYASHPEKKLQLIAKIAKEGIKVEKLRDLSHFETIKKAPHKSLVVLGLSHLIRQKGVLGLLKQAPRCKLRPLGIQQMHQLLAGA